MKAAETALVVLAVVGAGCSKSQALGIPPERVADYLHTVIEADRVNYTEHVVNRLQNVERKINASEHWREEKALPLPSQMLRMGSQATGEKSPLRYALISPWSINRANSPKGDFEKKAIEALQRSPDKPYYAYEDARGKRLFRAMYADRATSPACVSCHNEHPESPRHDFKMGEVMGGLSITIPLD